MDGQVELQLQHPHRLIRASAGSGKTYQLTQHYLELLRRGAGVDAILATTFTRKAAGEILGRLVRVVIDQAEREAADPTPTTDPRDLPREMRRKPFGQILDELTAGLHRVGVSTIDSFFHRLGGGFRFELDLPLEPRLIEEGSPEAAALRAEAITTVLAEASADDAAFNALLDLLRRLHHDQAARSVTQAIDRIVVEHAEVYRAAPDAERWGTLEPVGLLDEAGLLRQRQRWQDMEPDLPTTAKGTPNKVWQNAWLAAGQAADGGDWDQLIASGLLKKILGGETRFSTADIPEAWVVAAQPWINHCRGVLIERINRQTSATHELMRRFALAYEQLRARRGVMLFSDMAHRLAGGVLAGRTLSDDQVLTEVYFRLDAAVTHLLLDEFQDTSLDQWSVLEPFVEQIGAVGDGSRSLFVVGDTKQAIYGWRGGCVELFESVKHRVPLLKEESLAVSFRSSQRVLDAVNAVFTDLPGHATLVDKGTPTDLEAAAAWADSYQTHRAHHADRPGVVVLACSPAGEDSAPADPDTDHEDADADRPANAHEAYVAQQVAELHARTGSRSIGVLTRTNPMVRRLLHELRRAGLPASGEGGNSIADAPAVAAVLSAMQMADHPGDSASAFHLLNSPLGAVLRMTRLHQADRVARAIRRQLLDTGYAATTAAWTASLAPHADPADLAKLTRLVRLAEQYQAGLAPAAQLRPARFVDFIEGTRVEEPTPSPIRVMTIHRSKGLEFDAVVLPELDAPFSNRFDTLTDRPDPTGPIHAVFRGANAQTRSLAPRLQDAYDQQQYRQRLEDFCTLYVAMTRARHGLYPILRPSITAKGKPASPRLASAWILRDALGDPAPGQPIVTGDPGWMLHDPPTTQPPPAGELPVSTPPAPAPLRLTLAHGQPARRHRTAVQPSQLHADRTVDVAELLATRTAPALTRGTDLHQALENFTYVDDTTTHPPPDSPPDPRLTDALQHPAVRASLTRRYPQEELWRERSFMVQIDGRLIRGSFDRLAIARDPAGHATAAHLIDFKSDRVPAEGPILGERVEAYRPQVQAYCRALSQMLNLAPRQITAELLFLGPGVAVPIDPPPPRRQPASDRAAAR